MTIDAYWPRGFKLDLQHGYESGSVEAPRQNHPRVVANLQQETTLRAIRSELKRCTAFHFSVAFVSPRAIALLKQELVEFEGQGQIVTSDYLSFNSPTAFAELLNLRNLGIDVRLHSSPAFHPKGYIFEHPRHVTVMMGSANLTENALVTNVEWNLKVAASRGSDLERQIQALLAQQAAESFPLTQEWIDEYASTYTAPERRVRRRAPGHVPQRADIETGVQANEEQPPQRAALEPESPFKQVLSEDPIVPNAMQREALLELEDVRRNGARRALIISATGTGKTILSALDVRTVNPHRMLFLVHREQVVDRTMSEYRRVLGGPASDYGKVTGAIRQVDRRFVFSTVQTFTRPDHLQSVDPCAFDYVIIDEAHRSGAPTYQRILNHLEPRFLLGMTATPERTDTYNVFELFHHNVPYEIRLGGALEADMLAPFHYYGISDIEYADGTVISGESELSVLVRPERVNHLVKALETYGQAGVAPKGLIFCSGRSEAGLLSEALNQSSFRGRLLRTLALTGQDSVTARESAVARLERGELDYLLTVDVFNEGVDIPTVNQIVMLRNTQSPIVFVQQLGRGLRKAAGKSHVVVLDFIGNYSNSFMIPIALFGDNSLNKENLRKEFLATEESGVLAGISSVRFDRVAQARVLASIAAVKLDSSPEIKNSLLVMSDRVGRPPRLWDFYHYDSVDPVILATRSRHFPALLYRMLGVEPELSSPEDEALFHLSQEMMTNKRIHEFLVLRRLLTGASVTPEMLAGALDDEGAVCLPGTLDSSLDTFTLDNCSEMEERKFKRGVAVRDSDGSVTLRPEILAAYRSSGAFAAAVDDVLDTGEALVRQRYRLDRPFVMGRQYGRRDAARILGWPRKFTATIYGYRVDTERGVCAIFVTLHKSESVTDSTAYEDALLDIRTMRWFTRSRRSLASGEVIPIVANTVALHVFVKKDDAEGADFYYLGRARSRDAVQQTMPSDGKQLSVVRMLLDFDQPIERSLYDYFQPELTDS